MNNLELIRILAKRMGLTQKEVRRLLSHSTSSMRMVLDQDLKFTLPRLGTFETRIRKERKSYNPHYKKYVILPIKRVVLFHSSAALKRHTFHKRINHD